MRKAALSICCAVALTVAITVSTPARPQGGISLDEYFRLFPHFPVEVKAVVGDGTVVISWQKPPAPQRKVGYDSVVASYKVYRVSGDDRRLLGETKATTFADRTPLKPGTVRRYEVKAVQRDGRESGPSAAAEVAIPAR